MSEKIRIGDLLLKNEIISQEQLDEAIASQKKNGLKLGQALIKLAFIKEDKLLEFLSKQLDLPVVDLRQHEFNRALIKQLPETYARRFRAIPLSIKKNRMLVGMSDPLDLDARDQVEKALHQPYDIALVREDDLLKALNIAYRRTDEISSYAEALHEELEEDDDDSIELSDLSDDASETDAPVIRLIQSIFEDAVQVGASDIHIEPGKNHLRIRLRVDGVSQEQVMKQVEIASALAQRLKLMGGLNIAEKRLPQDGRFSIRVNDKHFDIRLSTMPSAYGESVVMRLLEQSGKILTLEQIGMQKDMLKRFRHLINHPHGVILVTGPTGSGKSTTLYAVLSELDTKGKKIITIEDPIEYRMKDVVQVQVKPKIKLDFARVLRTTLRQDPDIVLVGEMRDEETASIAMRAAMTGHLVLSTLHTNDAASTAIRLIDMGVEGFLVASALVGVLAQRLVRKVCDSCAVDSEPDEKEKVFIEQAGLSVEDYEFKRGKGCSYCNKTGYKGRMGIFELLEISPEMMVALRSDDSEQFSELTKAALKKHMLFDSGMKLVKQGLTTISEVMRIAGADGESVNG